MGLLAAGLTLLHPYLFKTVLYPINDLAYVLLALLTTGLAWETVLAAETTWDFGFWILDSGQQGVRGQGRGSRVRQRAADRLPIPSLHRPPSKIQNPKSKIRLRRSLPGLDMQLARRREAATRRVQRLSAATGIAAGLLIWSKPTGAVLLVGLVGRYGCAGGSPAGRATGPVSDRPITAGGIRKPRQRTPPVSRSTFHASPSSSGACSRSPLCSLPCWRGTC